MKNYAQAILQYTGYPLEPIVALELKKSFQTQPIVNRRAALLRAALVTQTAGFTYKSEDMDERWFSNYE